MADTALQVVVSPLLGVVFDNLSSLISEEFGLVWGVKKEMNKMSRTLSIIKDVLNDAEERQAVDLAVRNWLKELKELKDAAYEADDILDECASEGLQLASEMRKSNFAKKVTYSLKQVKFRHKIGIRIKQLRERFDEIAKERSQFHLQKGITERRVKIHLDRETSSILTERQVYGRDEDTENLVRLLLNNANDQEDISVCPILGIGGLGKTTLSQLVYNHASVEEHFEVKSWVCVSDNFDIKHLIKAIIASLSGNSCSFEELDPLQRYLQEKLAGKRFLLVLDDVWEESQDAWNKLMASLRCGAKGSFVLVTTRLKMVASITGTLPPYCLKVLSEDDCWSLFKLNAFGFENEERTVLVEIGKEIVKKCGGVPLAAKALGGLMRFKNEPHEWSFVRDSEIWELPENHILPALRLSYNHLPSDLKQCFAYCSIYPKDHRMYREKLIHLWIANGLVQSKGRMDLEDVGNEIFSGLLWRSLFQDLEKDGDGNIEACRMHDLVHDLACHIAADECSVVDVGSAENITRRTRHVSLFFSEKPSSSVFESIQRSTPCLRTLISLNYHILTKENCMSIFSNLTRLRALDLKFSVITEIPDSIGKLTQLRYLNLSHNTCIRLLPESICGLRNIQMLILNHCFRLQLLPKDMRKMSSLRHIEIEDCFALTSMPSGMGQLTCLKKLSFFIVGEENGVGVNELHGLDLGGKLLIRRLEHVKESMAAKGVLLRKEHLHSLRLVWSKDSELLQGNATEVIEGLQPHSNLRRFFVQGYGGLNFPSWLTVLSVPNLIEIRLRECRRCETLPPLGKLPLLKGLKIRKLDSVKFIDDEVVSMVKGFPSLEELELYSMPNLEGWSSSQGSEVVATAAAAGQLLPCLKRLIIDQCPRLTGVPLPLSVQFVKMKRCNKVVLGSLQNLPCLSSLELEQIDELVYFPQHALRDLTSLGSLSITSCENLKTLPVELSTLSLCFLSISDCKELVSLPPLQKSSLRHLIITDCPQLELSTEKHFQHLIALQRLTMTNLPKLTCFPEWLKHTLMLQVLSILNCSKDVMDLPDWIGTLTSLQKVYVNGCKNRKVLPEGIQRLTALQKLEITGCNADLERRCKNDKGEDWYKIAHIPHIYIECHSGEYGI